MECGGQCVKVAGITMIPELCANNWGMVEVSSFIEKRTGSEVETATKKWGGSCSLD